MASLMSWELEEDWIQSQRANLFGGEYMRGRDNVQAVPWLLLTALTQVYSDRQWQARQNDRKNTQPGEETVSLKLLTRQVQSKQLQLLEIQTVQKKPQTVSVGKWERYPHPPEAWTHESIYLSKREAELRGPRRDSLFENNSLGKHHSDAEMLQLKEAGTRTKQCQLPGAGFLACKIQGSQVVMDTFSK